MTNSPPSSRGRPHGSTDSYKRLRAFTKKRPDNTTLELVIPPIKNLITAAQTLGQHIANNKPYGPAQEDVERATTILLAAIKDAIDNG